MALPAASPLDDAADAAVADVTISPIYVYLSRVAMFVPLVFAPSENIACVPSAVNNPE